MESRVQDLETVSRLRSARISAVAKSQNGNLDVLFHSAPSSEESQTYVVKLLDVYPGLGKVAGRRLMASLGIAPLARVADVTADQLRELREAIEGTR